jgi:hypothetical protein
MDDDDGVGWFWLGSLYDLGRVGFFFRRHAGSARQSSCLWPLTPSGNVGTDTCQRGVRANCYTYTS